MLTLCRLIVAYLRRDCLAPFPSNDSTRPIPYDVLTWFRFFWCLDCPTKGDLLELASNGALVDVLNDNGEVVPLLVRKPPTRRNHQPTGRVASLLKDEPTRIFVPILLRPLVVQRVHSDTPCHLGGSTTFGMLE